MPRSNVVRIRWVDTYLFNEIIDLLNKIVGNFGYPGIFLVSLVGNLIPFLSVPYLIFVVSLSNVLDPGILSITSALGATIGKLNSYLIGRGAGEYIKRSKYRRKFDVLRRILGDYTFIAIIIAASTPLPDDYIFIPVGLMRYSFPKTFIATLIGKTILTVLIAFGGKFMFELIGWETGSILASIVLAAVFTIAMVMYMKFNVEDWLEKRFLGE